MQLINKNRTYLSVALILIDQVTKFIALSYFEKSVVFNPVGAYSSSFGKLGYEYVSIFSFISFLVLIRLIDKKLEQEIGYYLIIAGGISNLVDRFTVGGVIDFIPSPFNIFGTLNLADCFITIGGMLLILNLFLSQTKLKKAN